MQERGMRLLFGASQLGLMGRMLEEARRAGLWVGGVTSQALSTVSSVPDDLDELVLAPNLLERRRLLIEEPDYVVFLPGGLGTLDELAGALLARQLGRLDRPVGILDPDGFYDRMIESVGQMQLDKYMAASVDSLLVQESDPNARLDRLAEPGREPPTKWPGMNSRLG